MKGTQLSVGIGLCVGGVGWGGVGEITPTTWSEFSHRHLRKTDWLMQVLPALFVWLVLLVAAAKMPLEEAALVVGT
jgi:hypothetical protein